LRERVTAEENATVSAVDDYLAGLPSAERGALERVRVVLLGVLPEADEGTSYGMPAFRYREHPVLGFRAAAKHLSVFPFSPDAIRAVESRLGDWDLSKGTIRFTPAKPLPDDVLADLVTARQREIDGS
jgi:uncharacterized protein YdhG (YjbR/CyaY superfamily)